MAYMIDENLRKKIVKLDNLVDNNKPEQFERELFRFQKRYAGTQGNEYLFARYFFARGLDITNYEEGCKCTRKVMFPNMLDDADWIKEKAYLNFYKTSQYLAPHFISDMMNGFENSTTKPFFRFQKAMFRCDEILQRKLDLEDIYDYGHFIHFCLEYISENKFLIVQYLDSCSNLSNAKARQVIKNILKLLNFYSICIEIANEGGILIDEEDIAVILGALYTNMTKLYAAKETKDKKEIIDLYLQESNYYKLFYPNHYFKPLSEALKIYKNYCSTNNQN